MRGDQPGTQAGQTVASGRPQMTLDIERVLDVSARQAIKAKFQFDPKAPLSVCVEFLVEGGPRVLWRIGRDLLQQGLYSTSGLGAVQMRPSNPEERATAWLQLTSGDMAALFELPVLPLAEWLEYTYELVPAGQELAEVDWDMATANLLHTPEAQAE
ncbi:SsgA family sporulation/cell division regulator [Streptomyces sp. 4503]|uniref:SsgA family sporulation/cell division regulator n=1 Tax=Streptomyces niphimycinicus TaxID=2842201 RepID=A0ABS6CFQ1_9ACTN|nr:SsgA family sporulation/cell division regulator [Streptomyces niphimycinicus]MBU3865731.1 SsgA family sporulation/cell division regulator [Streptomyces niphimycinicus]